MTDLPALDAEARELALDPTRSILLEAPAGSGKTTVLAQRLLRLLALVNEPEEVLAITFTRKAAAEMRERVQHALRDADPITSPQARRTSELAAAVRRRAQERGWSLEANPSRLRIQTIDSLNHSIASRLPIAARAGGQLLVHERPQQLHGRAARRTLEDAESTPELQVDIGLLFERLDNDWNRFERLLAQMLARRSHWLPLLARAQPRSLAQIVEDGLERVTADALGAAREVMPGELLAAAAAFAPLHALRADGVAAGMLRAGTAWPADPGVSGAALPWWQCLASLALNRDGAWRRRLDVRDGFPPAEAPLREAALAWIGRLAGLPGLREALAAIAALPSPPLDPEDGQALAALSRVLWFAAAELEVIFRETGRVDHPFVAAAARRALTEEGEPTDLALRLGAAVRHILIDEFQDTSNEQFELLRALTSGWEQGDGRTLFAVGDPMQSIYQFREAEVGVFLRARRFGLAGLPLQALRLTRNFRSLPQLVEWSNATFSRLFPTIDDPRSSAVRHSPSLAARAPAEPAVLRVCLTPSGDPQAEALEVLSLVSEMRARAPSGSIAILVAARTHATAIAGALSCGGIPVAGIDLVPLAEVPVVRDLAALTRALDHRADRTAWLALLRAPWCGLTLGELALVTDRGDPSTVWESLQREETLKCLPAQARMRVERFRAPMQRALAAQGRLALAELVEATWLGLGGPSACRKASELADAEAFLRALARRSAEPDWSGPHELDELLGELFASNAGAPADAVQIMTMHRAKGLEFDRVILPSLGRRPRSSPDPLLRWLDLPREREGSDLLLAPLPAATRRAPDALNQFLKGLARRRADCERVRLLYVATTRARFELHLIGQTDPRHPQRPAAGSLLEVLWPVLGEAFLAGANPSPRLIEASATAPASASVPRDGLRPGRMLRRLPASWQAPAPAPGPPISGLRVASYEPFSEPELTGPGQTARHVGTAVHVALQRIAQSGELPTAAQLATLGPQLRAELAGLGVGADEIAAASRRALDALSATLQDDRGRWILESTHAQAASELALTGLLDGRLVSVAIDRCFVDRQGQRWVVDFKTSVPRDTDVAAFLDAEEDRYRPQLEKYAALARALGPEPVRAALYFPMLAVFRECEIGSTRER